MKARSILMSAPMVRALLDGRKTQTRRVVKGEALRWLDTDFGAGFVALRENKLCPYGVPGDLLWVRETWQFSPQKYCSCPQGSEPTPCDDWSEGTGCRSNRSGVDYRVDGLRQFPWRPSIFMPRPASRLTLEITEVRVEGLQQISEVDAIAEGIEGDGHGTWKCYARDASQTHWAAPREIYRTLWTSINGPGSWEANPWVWALTFKVHKANVDTILGASA
jgi:hypothetical protein